MNAEVESEDDEFGPALPSQARRSLARSNSTSLNRKPGPVLPSMQDLQVRDELNDEDIQAAREDLAYDRKLDRNVQKERLEELVPRADPCSRERQLEKKRKVTETVASFRDAKEGGTEEVPESDLLGDDGIQGYKWTLLQKEKKKSQRELRREEEMRATAAEREERMKVRREVETKQMESLRELARARFG